MTEIPLHSQTHTDGVQRLADRLEKPLLDNRSYRVVKLSNELEALLIHDPDTDKASAAMDVNVGSFSDSDDLPGMAHAVEHLLFMGTEKYPGENDYNQYLTKFGGNSNAYTAATSTNYYFELSASAKSNSPGSSVNTSKESLPVSIANGQAPLYGALDRFAQFFVKPLFLEDTLDRELKAVDSENKKNLQSDAWREMQLHKSLSSKEHPFHKFSTGNYEVLHDDPIARGVKIRDAFMGFYEKHYSANRMKLAVLGKESLDELQSWTVEFFSDVPNQSLEKLRWDDLPLYGDEEVGTQIMAKPVMERRKLDMFFTYPDEEELYDSQPSRYLSHLLGHEGPGSILAYLKAKGWCNGLGAGAQPVCPGSSFFALGLQLTEEGLKNYKEVITIIFNYIAMLKEHPPHKWMFEEMSKLQEVDFRFREKIPASRTTSMLSQTMQKPLPRDKLLSGHNLLRTFNPEGIKLGLAHLNPDNFRFVLISKDLETDRKEKWYGTDYKCEKISPDFMQSLKKAAKATASQRPAELFLPGKNEFVPQRLDVEKKEVSTPAVTPTLIRSTNSVRTWFKKDDQFWVPKANLNVHLRTPLLNITPLTAVTGHLYKELVEDALNEYAYDAELAGLDYNISPHSQGFDVSVSGYNDKMHVLLEKVLLTMRDLDVKQERFDVLKERLGRAYRNIQYADPFRQISTYSRWLVSDKTWLSEQYEEELANVTVEDVRAFYPQLLRQMFVEILVHGNLYKEDALRITDLVLNTLKPLPLSPTQWQTKRMLVPPPGTDIVYPRTLVNPDNVNHCIDYILLIGANIDYTTRAKLLLLAQMTKEPIFDTLRTKEQLGYVVASSSNFHSTLASFRILIQSERDCDYLEGRIETFLTGYANTLREMPHEEFEAQRVGLINKRLETLKNLNQETGRLWRHVTSEVYDFELIYTDVQHIEPLTKDDMLEFFTTYFHPSSATRSKAAVHMLAQAKAEDVAKNIDPVESRTKLAAALSQVLQQLNITADPSALSQNLEKVDVAGGDTAAITTALTSYLKESGTASEEQLTGLNTHAPTVLAQILPQLGIKAKGTGPDDGVVEDLKVVKKNKTVVIEDVKAWKASLPLSAGPVAVNELSAFEEVEAKL
ncbi:metalloprotease [Recurvomyces mirabilis]|uniref:Metalloprotease n=1 Tax=Recurvomyces mirabilis TaxID=574656 RepID=A0AAE0WWR9_9PEZI|nr:metalloprotease [Recurvomyces mirabilis]KAK5161848.1 metalloprotease [Recurvomyces mirabilis]